MPLSASIRRAVSDFMSFVCWRAALRLVATRRPSMSAVSSPATSASVAICQEITIAIAVYIATWMSAASMVHTLRYAFDARFASIPIALANRPDGWLMKYAHCVRSSVRITRMRRSVETRDTM
jgi:hypothetical protein